MIGSDPAGAGACENTQGPTPSLGRLRAGSLPSPPNWPVRQRPAGPRRRKTPPLRRISGQVLVNRSRAKL